MMQVQGLSGCVLKGTGSTELVSCCWGWDLCVQLEQSDSTVLNSSGETQQASAPEPAAVPPPHWHLLAFNSVLHHSPMEIPQMDAEARTTQCLDCGQKTRLKKADRGKKKISPHPQDTSPAEFRHVSAPALHHAFHGCISKGAPAEPPQKQAYRCVCRRHRVYWFKNPYLNSSRSYLVVWKRSTQYISVTLCCSRPSIL